MPRRKSTMIRLVGSTMRLRLGVLCIALGAAAFSMVAIGQAGQGAGRGAAQAAGGYDDRQNMMDQLKITALRPGKSGQNQVGKGFELENANEMMATLPNVLVFKNGTKVTTPEQWARRRAEIVE